MLASLHFVAILALFVAGLPPAQEDLLPAPYQVESVVRFRSDRWVAEKGLSLNPPLVAVDLGAVAGAPVPSPGGLQTMTVVGTRGVAAGRLEEIQQRCDYLCGEAEGEECHYVGLVRLGPGRLEEIGTPLVALPGEPALRGFTTRSAQPLAGEALQAVTLTGRALTRLAWDPYPEPGLATRVAEWSEGGTRVEVEARWGTGDLFEATGRDCRVRRIDELTEVSCDGLALVLELATPLLFSYPDYNVPSAEIVASLSHGERTYYVILLGLKAQNVVGLLVRADTGWRGLFRPRDYALLC